MGFWGLTKEMLAIQSVLSWLYSFLTAYREIDFFAILKDMIYAAETKLKKLFWKTINLKTETEFKKNI